MSELLDTLQYWVGAIMLVSGGLFALIGGIGLLRFPDLYARMHASGITDTLGAMLVLGGLILHSGLHLNSFKLVAIAFFLLMTSPTATHALARAAWAEGVRPELPDEGDESSND